MIKTWMSHGYDKVRGADGAPEKCNKSYDLYLAKNESEGCQISLFTDRELKNVSLTVQGEHDGLKCEVFVEHYVIVRGVQHPDPLVPYSGPFNVIAGTPKTIYFDFTAAIDAKAGNSVYTVTFNKEDGSVIDTFEINVKVWNFALPITPACETAVAITSMDIYMYHQPETKEEKEALLKSYYDMLLDHRMSAYSPPYDILDPRADEYMSDPRVTSFTVDYETASKTRVQSEEKYAAIGKKISSNPDWFRKAYAYPFDEPTKMEHLNTLKERCEQLDRLIPGIQKTSPFYTDIDVDENTDQVDFMANYNSIWCPKAKLFREIYSEEQAKKYAPFAERMLNYKKQGYRLWWYVCNYPLPPYFNVLTNDPGIESRAIFWHQYRYDVDGFLYWGSTRWYRIPNKNVWNDVDTFRNDVHGDGILFFPGCEVGINGPVPSIRLKIIRDGIEDFDLFKLAEKVIGRDAIVEKILSATPSLVEMAASSDEFSAIRIELGNAVEAAMNK